MSTDPPAGADAELIESLAAARSELERATEQVEAIGESRLRDLESALEGFTSLLSQYEESAAGSGDFRAFVEFQERLEHFVSDLPEDLPERETFEEIDETLQKRRLTDGDFEWARDRLDPVRELVDRLEARAEAEKRVRALEGQVREAIHEARERIDRLERVRRLGQADLDAPVADLRDPIERYNESVRAAVDSFRSEAPARDVLALRRTASHFPLVPVSEPPPDLVEYLRDAAVGAEPIPTLLEYAEYSHSKLDHYVEHPRTFSRVVGGNRTYLASMDADPFTIEWPPPAADRLRFRGRELVSLVNRFAPEATIAALRTVLDFARTEPERYARLRRSARARSELSASERERLAEGAVEADLDAERDRLAALEAALEEGSQSEAS
ncbi:MAG: hypothetical protein ABEJ60_06970 [Halodesulfurarchaeum sp.]